MTETPPANPTPPAKLFSSRLRGSLYLFALLVVIFSLGLSVVGSPWFIRAHVANPIANSIQVKLQNTVDTRLDALETKVGELNDRVNALASSPQTQNTTTPDSKTSAPAAPNLSASDLARLQSDVVSLSSALSALQAQMKQIDSAAASARDSAQTALGAIIAFMQLRDAAMSGHGFSNQLTAMRNVSKSDPALMEQLVKLDPYAAQGAPTTGMLRETLAEHESSAINATEKAQAEHWWQRIWIEIKGLVSIRPLHGGGMTGTFAAIDESLLQDDEAAALENYAKLWPESQKVLDAWHTQLLTRQAIDDALHNIAAHFTANASPATPGTP